MYLFFFFNDTATTEIYTLSLHDGSSDLTWSTRGSSSCPRRPRTATRAACPSPACGRPRCGRCTPSWRGSTCTASRSGWRSEEHTSELQSRQYLVCRLLLEKKNNTQSHLR